MKILAISDTHGQHRELKNLPQADMIIHSGDISWAGTSKEVVDFIEWFGSLEYQYKIFIGGNHDFCLEGAEAEVIQDFLPENCFYLSNSGITIDHLNFWGVPFFFSDDASGRFPQIVAQIPSSIDILITHCPPHGILDQTKSGLNLGNKDLQRRIEEIKPQYHLFGHIHEAYGKCETKHTTYINGSLLDENYKLINEPLVFELIYSDSGTP